MNDNNNNNNNGNNFNMNNPFLALENNNTDMNMNAPVNYNNNNNLNMPVSNNTEINNNVPMNNSIPLDMSGPIDNSVQQNNNIDAVLGINLFNNNIDENAPKPQELDSILGLNNQSNDVNQSQSTEMNKMIDSNIQNQVPNNNYPQNNMINNETPEEKNLDNILGLNGTNNGNNINQNNENDNANINVNNNAINTTGENEMTKAQKTLHNDFIVLLILEVIVIGLSLTSKEGELNYFNIIYAGLTIIGFFLTMFASKKSWIIGLIIGTAMILSIITGDIIDAILGLFVIIHSIMCIIENIKMKKVKKV